MSNVAVLFNPHSGKGRAGKIAESMRDALAKVGLTPLLFDVLSFNQEKDRESALSDRKAAIVIGGDGTIMSFLNAIERTKIPLYMMPAGNESLFARECGMRGSPEEVAHSIIRGEIKERFFGEVNGRPFFSMVSIGLDAAIVDCIAQNRKGPIGHHGYILPTLKMLRSYTPAELTFHLDGKEIFREKHGSFIVGNTSRYALNIGFLPEATSHDALLHARFYPCETVFGSLRHYFSGLFSTNYSSQFPLFTGHSFTISSSEPVPVQADGEAVGTTPVTISATHRTIRVLEAVL